MPLVHGHLSPDDIADCPVCDNKGMVLPQSHLVFIDYVRSWSLKTIRGLNDISLESAAQQIYDQDWKDYHSTWSDYQTFLAQNIPGCSHCEERMKPETEMWDFIRIRR
jgi:hypothetical protein